jgi:hypothetical protein
VVGSTIDDQPRPARDVRAITPDRCFGNEHRTSAQNFIEEPRQARQIGTSLLRVRGVPSSSHWIGWGTVCSGVGPPPRTGGPR